MTAGNALEEERFAAALRAAPIFIVGCPRSGTTLLRLMVDSHPRVAIPPESYFPSGLAPPWWRRPPAPEATLERILRHPWFLRWHFDAARVRKAVDLAKPADYPSLIRAVFAAYAAAHGKVRWGDKTPWHVTRISLLARLFPDALFVHIIRDGREVAASLAEHHWGPGPPIVSAFTWRRRVRAGRRVGAPLGASRYAEVRYEALVERPEATLRCLCRFLGEEYAPSMLEYYRAAADRLPAVDVAPSSGILLPPTPGVRDWRAGLSQREQRAVEAACRPVLRRLGYDAPQFDLRASGYAWLVDLPAAAGRYVDSARSRLARASGR